MPAQRPRASFDPIPPELDVDLLVETTENFGYVPRISCEMIEHQGYEAFDKLVLHHVILGGKPLVIDGYHMHLDPWTFSSKWLQDNHGDKVEQARDLRKEALYTSLTLGHYLRNMGLLADQFFDKPDAHKDLSRQRVYLKDIDCPDVWRDKLRELLPPNLFYLNSSCGELGGPGSVDEALPTGGKRKGRGIAGVGDLMCCLPPAMRAENLMCYIGHEGTYTPSHREMCASMGHNIMIEASGVAGDDGRPERPGSSIWFMTETKDRKTVSEYWLSILGHDIEVEKYFAQIAAWKNAPFKVYVVDQRPGDFILIPPMAPHQVWNRGTRTMKVAWNRTTVETLDMAFKEALPNARMVCRDEQYKNKAIVYYTLQRYSSLLAKVKDQQQTASSPQEAQALRTSSRIRHLQRDFRKLLHLFKDILLSEMFSPDHHPPEKTIEFLPFDSNVTCSYCRGNIFNRFLTCKTCEDMLGTAEPEPYDICMDCYVMGRSCGCISKLKWTEQFKWKELTQKYDFWRRQYIELEGALVGFSKTKAPLSLADERAQLGKKTLAQICQEQLQRRPWIDVHKPAPVEEDENNESDGGEVTISADGSVRHKKKKRSEAWLKNHHACHVCCHRHEKWKMAICDCGRHWCYGTLFRGCDQMPQQIMEETSWKCPHCRGVCFAGACRKDPRQKPYEPKGTLLGHDTRKVADARSVESLVDFGVSNLNFLRETVEAPTNNARLKKRQEEADQAREMEDDEGHLSDNDGGAAPVVDSATGIEYSQYSPDKSIMIDSNLNLITDTTLIDPMLRDGPNNNHKEQQLRFGSNPSNNTLTSAQNGLEALLNNDSHNESGYNGMNVDGYRPAQQSTYVAPAAVMIQAHDFDADGDAEFSSYPDLDDTESIGAAGFRNAAASKSKKRKYDSLSSTVNDTIKRGSVKKVKRIDEREVPAGPATQQYRKEQERKALEEARKTGHFNQMQAALRGKSLIIRLKVGRSNMARIIDSYQAVGNGSSHARDLLESDIKPPSPSSVAPEPLQQPALSGLKSPSEQQGKTSHSNGALGSMTAAAATSTTPTADRSSKAIKVRVERDDDFGVRRRGRGGGENKRKSNTSSRSGRKIHDKIYEEVEIDSDHSDDDENGDDNDARGAVGTTQLEGALETTETGRKKRRESAWQSQRHKGENSNLPEALPDDWKDGGGRRRRQSPPVSVQAANNLSSRSLSTTTNGQSKMKKIPSGQEEFVDNNRTLKAVDIKATGMQSIQNGRRTSSTGSEDDDDENDEELMVKPVASSAISANSTVIRGNLPPRPPFGKGSILDRNGPGKPRVKIVSAASRASSGKLPNSSEKRIRVEKAISIGIRGKV